jgi:hypothetical protein
MEDWSHRSGLVPAECGIMVTVESDRTGDKVMRPVPHDGNRGLPHDAMQFAVPVPSRCRKLQRCSTRRRRGRSAGTPFVPTTSGGHGAQERSRDETAWRRARQRASLDGSEHRGIRSSDHKSVSVMVMNVRGELAIWRGLRATTLHSVIRLGIVTMMQPCVSVSEAPWWWRQSR